jgi:hypothetical protein
VSSDTTAVVTFAVVACLVLLVGLAPAAPAAPSCGDRVLLDWSEDGRVDHLYPLQCYEEALDDLPADLRDYTDAADVIERALQSAVRSGPVTAAQPPDEPSSTSRRLLLVGLAGGSVALAAAAVIGLVGRRRGSEQRGPRR